MTVTEIIAIIMTASSLVTALSLLWAKFIHPIKKVIKQVEDNTKQIQKLEGKIAQNKTEIADQNAFDTEARGILIESLVAVLDGLEQVGANHIVTEQKRKLITFLSKQVSGK